MGRPHVSWADFVQLGNQKGLDYLGPINPADVPKSRDTVRWRCRITGEEVRASYSAVRDDLAGHRYRNVVQESMLMYQELARRLGIEFVYDPRSDYFPANTKRLARWRNRWGHEFEASYHELAYGKITQRLQQELEARRVH